MKSLEIVTIGIILIFALNANAQIENSKTEIEQITETLMDYIEGTANGEPERLEKLFILILICIQ